MKNQQLLQKISHSDFKTFAKEAMIRNGVYKRLYIFFLSIFGLSFCACLGYCSVFVFTEGKTTYLIQFLLALFFCFSFLIILHELLHGLAYKLVGARKVYFGAKLSQFVFYAGCDDQKFNGVQFRLIALFPFVCISLLGLAALFLFPSYFLFTITVLGLHTLCCSGDFAVMNYIQQYDLKKVFTYDLKAEETTYFYLKEKTNN